MTKPRTPDEAQKAVEEAKDLVVEQGDTPIANNLWDAHEAALDGQPKQYLADIISGKREGPYRPTSGWRAR
jgi:hypothetical protein